MTEKEAIELFEKAKFLYEQADMERDIENIRCILLQNPINMNCVMEQIGIVKDKHSENIKIFNIIFPPQGNSIPLTLASDKERISDLIWKLSYLQAKKKGKTFEEFCKAMRNISQENQNGGTMYHG